MPLNQTTQERISGLRDMAKIYADGKLKSDLASLDRKYYIEFAFTFIIPAIVTISAVYFTNFMTAFAPLLITVSNAADKLTVSKTLIATYGKDKDGLESRYPSVLARLRLAEIKPEPADQNKILDDIEKKLSEWMPIAA